MTKEEYLSLNDVEDLPLYEENDQLVDTVDSLSKDGQYTACHEAETLAQALNLQANPLNEFKGGIIYRGDDGYSIFAYFWEKRVR